MFVFEGVRFACHIEEIEACFNKKRRIHSTKSLSIKQMKLLSESKLSGSLAGKKERKKERTKERQKERKKERTKETCGV